MDLSVVVVNWNSGEHLERLLQSLQEIRRELREVIVVDNASEDQSPECARSLSWVNLLCQQENLGFAGAANLGIRTAEAPFVLLLNPDLMVVGAVLETLYHRIQNSADVAIDSGQLVDADHQNPQAFQLRPLPDWRRVLKDVLFFDELLDRPSSAVDRGWSEVEQPAAAFWLLRKTAWEGLGGFDTRFYPAWFEDVDFCKRARGRGWRILHLAEPAATHVGGLSLGRLGYRAFVEVYYRNLLRYLRKHHPRAYPLLWLPVKCGTWVRKYLLRRPA